MKSTARVIGGWILSSVFLYYMLAREPVLDNTRIGLTSVVVVMILLLVGAALHRDAFAGSSGSTAIYLIYTVAAGAIAVLGLLRATRAGPSARIGENP
jgi:predicted permease